MLDEVRVSREEQVMQFVHAHTDRRVDEQPPAEVSAERLHLTCRAKEKFVWMCDLFSTKYLLPPRRSALFMSRRVTVSLKAELDQTLLTLGYTCFFFASL